jgi:hypothetical protein
MNVIDAAYRNVVVMVELFCGADTALAMCVHDSGPAVSEQSWQLPVTVVNNGVRSPKSPTEWRIHLAIAPNSSIPTRHRQTDPALPLP